jgi:hypothetical protein
MKKDAALRKTKKILSAKDYLTRADYQARVQAEVTALKRHYCSLFGFWRDCGFKLCRRARSCRGDQDACLKDSVDRVPRHIQFQARQDLLAKTPRHMAAPERAAREFMPSELGAGPGLQAVAPPPGWKRAGSR